MITKQEIEHVAKLARLGLTKEEIKKAKKDLSSIFDYAESLKEVNIEGIEPTSHSVVMENVMREDKANRENKKRSLKLLEAAPDKKDNHLKVKSIF
ncbi:MAG: Asp-tRNA(Asn)/Glu-tRNA(Gln) amidotransferase subunit GatC [bacterium]